jgi:hypothetical protein
MPAAIQSAWCTRVSDEPMVVSATTTELLQAIAGGIVQPA